MMDNQKVSGIAVLVVVLVAAGCKSESEKADDRSLLGCRNLREVAADYNDGALNQTELRARLQSVREDSEFAAPAVKAAADAAVRAVTAGDDAALGAAVTAMDAACKATGN